MNEEMIQRHNARVSPGDEVFMLGDFALKMQPNDVNHVISRLNGHKHLIVGNHDTKNVKKYRGFASVQPYLEKRIDGIKVCMMHFPILAWNRKHYGSFHLHGHSHGKQNYPGNPYLLGRAMDVGVDTNQFRPYEWPEIKSVLLARTSGIIRDEYSYLR